MIKEGANINDRAAMKKMFAAGDDAKTIGKALRINPKVVAKFAPAKSKAEK